MAVPFIAPMNYGRPKEARPHRFAYDYGSVDPGMFAPAPDRARPKRAPKRTIAYTIPLPDNDEQEAPGSAQGHILGVNALAVSLGESQTSGTLFSGGRDGVVKAWDVGVSAHKDAGEPAVATTTQRGSQAVHADWINDVVAVNDGKTAVTASSDMTVRAWTPGSRVQTVGSHMDYVKALAYSAGRGTVVSGGLDRQIREWDIGEARTGPVCALHGVSNVSSVYTLACNAQGLVVSGSPETVVRLWDLRAGRQVTTLSGHTDHIRAVLLSADSELVLSGSSDTTVKLWSMRMRRCLSTYTQHSDSVWALCSTHVRFHTFHSASRDGLVTKTAGDMCIAVAKEPYGVVKLAAAGDAFVWTATKGPHLNRWRDVSVHEMQSAEHSASLISVGQGRAPDEQAGHRRNRTLDSVANHVRPLSSASGVAVSPVIIAMQAEQARRNTDREEQFYDAHSRPDSGDENQDGAASISAVLAARSDCQLGEGAGNPPESTKAPANMLGPIVIPNGTSRPAEAGAVRSPVSLVESGSLTALIETESVAPVRVEPDETIHGRHGLHRHRVLPSRRHVLAQDTAGCITVWDIMQCRRVYEVPETEDSASVGAFAGVYGRDFDMVAETLLADPESVNSWCVVDTRIGVLTVHVTEAQAWDAEVHVDDVDGVPPDAIRAMGDHERVNIGQWMLKRLFLPYARARVKRGPIPSADAAALNRWAAQSPTAEIVPARATPRADSETNEPAFQPSVVSPLEATTAQIGIAVHAPSRKDSDEGHEPALQEKALQDKPTQGKPPQDMLPPQPRHQHNLSIDTAKSTTQGNLAQSPMQGAIPAKAEDGEASASNGSAGKFISRLKSMRVRKQKSTLAPQVSSPPPPLPDKDKDKNKEAGRPSTPPPPAGSRLASAPGAVAGPRDAFSEWAGPRYPTDTERTLTLLQTAPAAWEQLYAAAVCPRLPLPRNVSIMVFQECASASGPFLIFRGVGPDAFDSAASEAVLSVADDALLSFELCMPAWLADLLLFNRLPATFQEAPKISFVLSPAVSATLPPFPNPGARLVANRMLRARKLAIYVVEKLGLLLMQQPAPNYVNAVDACIRMYAHDMSAEGLSDYAAVFERAGEQIGDAERAALDDVARWRAKGDGAEYVGRPELYLHLACKGQSLHPKATLATIKANMWKTSTDVVVHYEWAGFVRQRIAKAQALASSEKAQ